MRFTATLIILSFVLTQELEVEGNLKVTGTIDAQGNPITNVGNPVNANDAVNMQTIDALADMKPERIYRRIGLLDESNIYTVPSSKIWIVYAGSDYSGTVYGFLNGVRIWLSRVSSGTGYNAQNVILFAGDTFIKSKCNFDTCSFTACSIFFLYMVHLLLKQIHYKQLFSILLLIHQLISIRLMMYKLLGLSMFLLMHMLLQKHKFYLLEYYSLKKITPLVFF